MELRIEEARGRRAAKFAIRQQWVPYSRISPMLKRAVIVTEDAAFFDHDGIDLEEIKASLEKNWEEGQFLRGGSTITQQLAKNLYLSPSRNPMRKVKELFIARRLEAALTKQRIFEIYLNMIEWGDGIFGCEAAARAYFGKPCASLDMQEAALMAGAIINPREHSPGEADPTAAAASADHRAAHGHSRSRRRRRRAAPANERRRSTNPIDADAAAVPDAADRRRAQRLPASTAIADALRRDRLVS